jgi:hypothetical protein
LIKESELDRVSKLKYLAGVMAKHEITTAAHNYFESSMFFATIDRTRKLYELRMVREMGE